MMEDKSNPNSAQPPAQFLIINPDCEKVTSRRSRKDEEGRDYQCGCGKRYLSYPALYTHIKTKHDGKQPEGTLKTGTNQITKRTKVKLEDETLRAVQACFADYQSSVITRMGEIAKGSVALHARVKKDSVPKDMYEQYLQIIKQHEFNLTEQSTIDLALLIFLINIGDITFDKVYEQFQIFARLARACFYDHGEQVYRALYAKKGQGPFQIKDFVHGQVKSFPIISDFMLKYYIPATDTKDAKQANLSMMESIMNDFCKWLYQLKLTNIKVNPTRTAQIDFQPPVNVPKKSTPGKIQSQKQIEDKDVKEGHDESEEVSEQAEEAEEQPDLQNHIQGSKEIEPQ